MSPGIGARRLDYRPGGPPVPRFRGALPYRRPRSDGEDGALPALRPRKEEAACCRAKRDEDGRLPIGFCGPECERRR